MIYRYSWLWLLSWCWMMKLLVSKSVLMEKAFKNYHKHFEKIGQPKGNDIHEIVIAIKQLNVPIMEKLLWNISTPGHAQYGHHLTRAEVAKLSSNRKSTDLVIHHLIQKGFTIHSVTPYGEYIHTSATISTIEKFLSTKFYTFRHRKNNIPFVRCEKYHLESIFQGHISSVFNSVQFPVENAHRGISHPANKARSHFSSQSALGGDQIVGTNNISVLNKYYNIDSNIGNTLASMSIFQPGENYYSPSDLNKFRCAFGIDSPATNITATNDAFVSDEKCSESILFCAEANLDVQYSTGLCQVTPFVYWHIPVSQDTFLSWVLEVSSSSDPPKIVSLSYGALEEQVASSSADSFNIEAMKLGLQGVTILASSGDDGVANYFAREDPSQCGYNPSFPSTSPYVTSVGSTQGSESNQAEISSSSRTNGIVTSGGGFSNLYSRPSYQDAAIAAYFNSVSTAAESGYNADGRGYPDVSFAGLFYQIIVAGEPFLISGTSAATPALQGLVSLVNSARLATGKSSLGFLNVAIYTYAGYFANDIQFSDNRCTAKICCDQGFYCAPGWDPVSGWGSVDYEKFYNAFINL